MVKFLEEDDTLNKNLMTEADFRRKVRLANPCGKSGIRSAAIGNGRSATRCQPLLRMMSGARAVPNEQTNGHTRNEIVVEDRPRRQTILRLLSASVASTSPFRWHYSRWRHCWGSTIGAPGIAWASTAAGRLLPIYLAVILAAASLYGLMARSYRAPAPATTFVNARQLRRVMQVFVPTLLFCLFTNGSTLCRRVPTDPRASCARRRMRSGSPAHRLPVRHRHVRDFDLAFDVIMPKGPLEAALDIRFAMEASPAASGFSVLLTWKVLAVMMVGLVLAFSSACCADWAAERRGDPIATHLPRWTRPRPS